MAQELAADYRRAAEEGNLKAQLHLALAYWEGRGVPQDDGEAVMWFEEGGQPGLQKAQYYLGVAYWEGRGAPQDYIEAHAWFNLAVAQGDGRARESRDNLARQMTRTQIGDAQRRARRRLDKTAEAIIAAVERGAREFP